MVVKGESQRSAKGLEQKLARQEAFYSGQIAAQASMMCGLEDAQKELRRELVRPRRLVDLLFLMFATRI